MDPGCIFGYVCSSTWNLFQTSDIYLYAGEWNCTGNAADYRYNYGAGSKKRVRDTIRYSLISAAVLMLVGTVVSLAIPDIILSMFQADAELMRAGMRHCD